MGVAWQARPALPDYARVVELWPAHEFALRRVIALSPDVDGAASHRGWLHKRGHMNTSYQRRYFLLHGAMVSYYEERPRPRGGAAQSPNARCKSKGEPIAARVAHVRPAQVSELTPDKASLAFSFESVEGKSFIVYADSAEEKLGWLRAIGKAVGGGHGLTSRTTVEKAYHDLVVGAEAPAGKQADASSSPGGGADGGGGSSSSLGGGGAASGGAPTVLTGWAQVAQGQRLYRAGNRHDEARMLLEKASASVGTNKASGVYVYAQYLLGKLLASKGMHAEAAAYMRRSADHAPTSCAQIIKLQLAWSLWHANRAYDAEAVYWEVLDEDVLCWQALVDRARMHLGFGSWPEALRDLAQVAAMGKADADVCNDLGVSHFEVGDYEQACHWFGEAIAKNASHAPAISNRANCLKQSGKLHEAEMDYTRAIEIDQTNPKAYMNRGLLLREQGKTTRAFRDYEKALQLDPRNAFLQDEVQKLSEKLAESGIATGGAAAAAPSAGGARDRCVSQAVQQSAAAAAGGEEPLRRERL